MAHRNNVANLRSLDLNLLPIFIVLMRERSVTHAGESLFLSQSATSAALARLRDSLQDELFLRRGAVLEPTPRAHELLGELTPALQAIAVALASAMPFEPATDARIFRVGWTDNVTIAAMPLLDLLRQAAPHCRLVIRSANYVTIPAMLDSGEIGTAVGFMNDDLPAMARQRVLRRGGFLLLRDAATAGPVTLDAYCARPHVLVTARGDLVGFADAALEKLGRSRQVVPGLPDFGLLGQVLSGSDLLCVVSDAQAESLIGSVNEHGLAADPLPFPARESITFMAWRGVLDQDPAEIWLRSQIVAVLGKSSVPDLPFRH